MPYLNLSVPKQTSFDSGHTFTKYEHFVRKKSNPESLQIYQQKKEKISCTDRVKFTIIGNCVTEEFIYCMNLVQGLYRCRPKYFKSPVIRGVTTVEWPSELQELKAEGNLVTCSESQVAVLVNDKYLGDDKELKQLVESKFVYHLSINYYKESVAQFASYVKSSGRPCAYMHISVNKEHIGTLIFMLYADVVPYTCENFLRLCKQKRGGYSGTPIHRVVKDGWIQGGGFHLKPTDMICENFIVPFDKRGVLAMANAERDTDCSTQFFVLLQPAPWMEHKYVAFGQLIDGAETLRKIEEVPTWYEDPLQCIEIHTAGILNLECQSIVINKGANEYIQGHIEDLYKLGEILFEEVMDKVFLEIDSRQKAVTNDREEWNGDHSMSESNIRTTKRFLRHKEDLQELPVLEDDNNEFDVEIYEYDKDEEQIPYQHKSPSSSVVVSPEKPFYIPLTDVPYPGEVDSTYDLKKLLRGDYCLESDLEVNWMKVTKHPRKLNSLEQQLYSPSTSVSHSEHSVPSLDPQDELDIMWYIQDNADRASFAGEIIRGIARSMAYFRTKPSDLLTDEELRRLKLNYAVNRYKKTVSLQPHPSKDYGYHGKIMRTPTGIVSNKSLEISFIATPELTESFDRVQDIAEDENRKACRTNKDYIREEIDLMPNSTADDNSLRLPPAEEQKRPCLNRLYRASSFTDSYQEPTIKNYRNNLFVDIKQRKKSNLSFDKKLQIFKPVYFQLKQPNKPLEAILSDKCSDSDTSTHYCTETSDFDDNDQDKIRKVSIVSLHSRDDDYHEKLLKILITKSLKYADSSTSNLTESCKEFDDDRYRRESEQPSPRSESSRSIHSNILPGSHHSLEDMPVRSLRSVEFSRKRPTITVSEYKRRNSRYTCYGGIRLPGDTPIYSPSSSYLSIERCGF